MLHCRLKVGENVLSLDQGETPICSESHPDPSGLHMTLRFYLVGYGLINAVVFLEDMWGKSKMNFDYMYAGLRLERPYHGKLH